MPQPHDRPHLVTAYTIALYVLGGLALMMVASHQMFIEDSRRESPDDIIITILRFVQTIALITLFFATSVGVIRSYRLPMAGHATAAVSIILLFWPPLGTAAFIWWVGWIRRYERPDTAS